MVLPRNEHLKTAMYVNFLMGVWPILLDVTPFMLKLYNTYFIFLFFAYHVLALRGYLQLHVLVNEDVADIRQIASNLCITLVHTMTIVRLYALKISSRIQKIIHEICFLEEKILKTRDEKMIEIYNVHAVQSNTANKLFIGNIFFASVLYFVHTYYEEDVVKFNPATNETRIIKPLPLVVWFPFDEQKYYVWSYSIEVFDVMLGTFFVTFSDTFIFSLIIFPLGQIRILIHILINFDKYCSKIRMQINCSKEEASVITLKKCIGKHKEIISYIEEFNSALKNTMVFDFLMSSIQLASIVLQILVSEFTLINFLFAFQYALGMLIRLLVYYWYANEIMLESMNIGLAIWKSKWYEQSQEVKKLMVIMIMRCNKALSLQIGSFGVMSLSTFLSILKATYSYMMVIYR